jgi:HEPN domain-containing protein
VEMSVVVDCHHCSTRVNAKVRGAVHDSDGDGAIVLAECPSCNAPLVGQTTLFQDENNNWRYEHAERVWPAPSTVELSASIPEKARRDIKEAQKCISHGIYSAAVVLCGRALERLAKSKAPGKSLHDGLAELRTQGVIDNRLFDWASVLRKERNLGAHATDEDVTRENAEDVLAFTVAIFEYVFTLSEKYAEFMARKAAHK